MPLLSVIVPCFNQGKYLLELIACFPNYQDQDIYELIIIDDGSTDKETLSILHSIKLNGIKVIRQANQGVCVARNTGIESSDSKYILPIDGDDKVCVELIFEAIDILEK